MASARSNFKFELVQRQGGASIGSDGGCSGIPVLQIAAEVAPLRGIGHGAARSADAAQSSPICGCAAKKAKRITS